MSKKIYNPPEGLKISAAYEIETLKNTVIIYRLLDERELSDKELLEKWAKKKILYKNKVFLFEKQTEKEAEEIIKSYFEIFKSLQRCTTNNYTEEVERVVV